MMDLVGKRYGRLEVVGTAPAKGTNTYWVCRCDCGVVKEVSSSNLFQGRTKSCGCLQHVRSPQTEKKPLKCPYPSFSCKQNQKGLCCAKCEVLDCKFRCQNNPQACGLLKGVGH